MEALGHWFTAHPQIAGLAVFLIALAESLAVVGLLVPGVAMMFAAGTLIGSGALEFAPICAWAVAGAVAGDSLSFWLGQHFRDRLPELPPFRRRPEVLERGVTFFRRYGGRSILFGRFVGPIRAVIPLIAGMLAMPAGRFLAVNIFSAALWAPAYLLPGMAFGASLDVASQVTGRLVTLLVVVLAGLWFTTWMTKHLYLFLQPRTHSLILWSFDLCKRHPLIGRLAAPLIDPRQRDYPGLAIWAAMLLALCLIVGPLIVPDLLPISLQALRTPWSDHVFTWVEALGRLPALAALAAMVGSWLAIVGRPIALAHWLAALGFGVMLWAAALLPPGSQSPIDRTTLWSTIAYGFLAVLIADGVEKAQWRRWSVYTLAAALVGALAFSRLYLRGATMAKLAFSGSIALIWLSLVGIAYRRHRDRRVPARGLAWIAVTVLAAVGSMESGRHSVADFEHRQTVMAVSRDDWLRSGWIELPEMRTKLFGAPTQELQIQWAASIDELRRALPAAGWRDAATFTPATLFNGLNPRSTPDQLPVLPHFNQDQIDRLRMIRRTAEGRWLILRFWHSGYRLRDNARPIWLGSCGRLTERQLVWTLRYTRQRNLSPENCGRIAREIAAANPSYRLIHQGSEERSAWLFYSTEADRGRDAAEPGRPKP